MERLAKLDELSSRAQAGLPLFEARAGAEAGKGRSLKAKSANQR